ncbi:MAG TPA: hypothetical protein VIL46_10065, partial [Gemmataceae bacterium]
VPPGPEPAGGASPAPAAGGPAPLAVSNAQPGGPAGSPALPPPQILNALKFELGYEVQESGPSGVGRVELWLTRDDGQTWQRWGEDEDRQSPIAVDLDVRSNPQLEGVYGFKIVVQSGAGLSKGPPVSGDPPDMRVDIDITPPVVKIYNPLPDPSQRDTLVLRWETSDRNPAPEPITLEWSEMPEGPWHPIVSGAEPGAGDSPPAVGTSLNRPARRLPDTGTYAWRVPPNMPTHRVYLRVTARDAAGNVAEARTPQPIEIDLNKPVAKIQGIVGVPPAPRR